MLRTQVPHVTNPNEHKDLLEGNENVMICCGRNGPMCLPVYDIMENLEDKYKTVTFRVMDFDAPIARTIRQLPEVRGFMGLPFTIYYKNGKVVEATSSIQSKGQVTKLLDKHFAN